ncbi:hypothetical protein QFC19_002540 [Naganishia cerealis]|uniref:Uncharacterized protein n=1 Tax=Naganishia cerealis TaxID=610337 RepID=A0ACC2WAE8_9TREE|nr:hypothetical protein QFC19_002540 [Naganishia cerealis]
MTRTLLSTQVVKDDQIYQLCRILSHESYQPSSVQVLYFLLQPIVQHALKHQDDIGRALRKSYGESLQITTFGDVPSLDQLESIQDLRSPWGVAVLWKDASDNRVRGRFWISTEPQARTSPDTLNRQQKWQPDEQSIRVLNTMCHSLFQPFVSKQQYGSIFFNGTNQCWTETLATFGHKVYDGICTKAARRLRLDLDSRADCPAGYRMRPLAERDIQTASASFCRFSRAVAHVLLLPQVIDSNKIKFTPEYVRSRQYLSVAVVNAETDELASWAMTHSDCGED